MSTHKDRCTHEDHRHEDAMEAELRAHNEASTPRPFETEERLPIVFDLDGTLAESTYPEPHIGRAITPMLNLARRYHEEDNREIIIHTARPESHKDTIWSWVHLHGLETVIYDVICGKPRAALYIDDRAYNPSASSGVQGTEEGQGGDSDSAGQGRESSQAPAPTSTDVVDEPWDLKYMGESPL